MRDFYSQEVEELMITYYKSLSEKDRRHYAGLEALKLGHGGTNYISWLFRLNKKILIKAKEELMSPSLLEQIPPGRQRRPGGGRKKNETREIID
jgi:hypothetical protein